MKHLRRFNDDSEYRHFLQNGEYDSLLVSLVGSHVVYGWETYCEMDDTCPDDDGYCEMDDPCPDYGACEYDSCTCEGDE